MFASTRTPNLIIPPVSLVIASGLIGLFGGYSLAVLLALPLASLVASVALIGAAIGTMAGSYAITSLTERAQWNTLLIGQAIGLCAFGLLLTSIF